MNPVSAYIDSLRKYFDYHGRTSRREYWMFIIAAIGVQVIGLFVWLFGPKIVGSANHHSSMPASADYNFSFEDFTYLIFYLFAWYSAIGLPGLALIARRLNDIGWSRRLSLLVVMFMIPIPPFIFVLFAPIVFMYDEVPLVSFIASIPISVFGLIPGKKQVNDPSANEL